jgi:hypothetical protein
MRPPPVPPYYSEFFRRWETARYSTPILPVRGSVKRRSLMKINRYDAKKCSRAAMASLPWGWLEGQLHAIGEMGIENFWRSNCTKTKRSSCNPVFADIVHSRKMVGQPTVVSNTSDSRGQFPARFGIRARSSGITYGRIRNSQRTSEPTCVPPRRKQKMSAHAKIDSGH